MLLSFSQMEKTCMKQQKTAAESSRSLEERADDLAKVITFKIVTSVKKQCKTVMSFKEAYEKVTNSKASSAEQVKLLSVGRFTKKSWRKVLGSICGHGVRRWVTLADVIPFLPSWLHLQRNFTKHCKSGKSFRVHSYWYIEFSKLEELLADERWLDCNCREMYTKRQHDLIWRTVLKKKKEECSEVAEKEQESVENSKLEERKEDMTKAEREQYQREYDEGKRMLSLDEALKEEAKAKRRADKHRAAVAAKATEKVLGNYQELVLENDLLKKQVKELTQMNTELEAETAKLKAAKEKSADSMQESDRKLDLEERVKQLEKTLAERDDELFMLKDDNEELSKLVDELQAKLEAACPEKPGPEQEKQFAEFEKAVAAAAPELRKLVGENARSLPEIEENTEKTGKNAETSTTWNMPVQHPEDDMPDEEA